MKTLKPIIYTISLLLFLAGTVACNSKDKKTSKDKEMNLATKSVQGMVKRSLNLRNTESISKEDLEKWFPQDLSGMKLDTYTESALAFRNVVGATATYKGEGTKKTEVYIADGAGKGSSTVLAMFSTLDHITPEDTDSRSLKILDDENMQGAEIYEKNTNITKLSFLYKGRFAVSVNGYDMDTKATWKVTEELKLDKLF